MPITTCILAIIGAYLIGSIPTSVWIGKLFYGIDIRKHGSGNAGTTNTFRVLGTAAGIPVLIIDVLKGYFAVKLVTLFNYFIPGSTPFVNFELALGIAAVVGHIFPIYAGFKGGKGVATLLGVVLAVHLPSALIAISIFVVMLLISKYVSLSSLIAGFSFPFMIVVIYKSNITSLIIFSLAIFVMLLLTHQQNIERLLRHEESKANLFNRKNKTDKKEEN